MKRTLISALTLASLAFTGLAFAAEGATQDEATAMVKKGVSFLKTSGKDKGYAEISNAEGQFKDRDLYLTVYGTDGTVLAHGANAKMVGKNLMGLKDVDGKEFVKERVALAKTQPHFWQDYKFTDPLTKKVLPKAMYCEPAEGVIVCGGVYKR